MKFFNASSDPQQSIPIAVPSAGLEPARGVGFRVIVVAFAVFMFAMGPIFNDVACQQAGNDR